MIYLALDTDVLLNSLRESSNENNFIDRLIIAAKKEEIKLLVPEIIITEWERNKERNRKALSTEWKRFFNRASRVFSAKVLQSINTPRYSDMQVEKQLGKVEYLFENYSKLLPITDECKLKAIGLAEKKKAPFRSKNSIGDAYIYVSIVSFAEQNHSAKVVFITNNVGDFSQGKTPELRNKLHHDLKDDFERLHIRYYTTIESFFIDYKDSISDTNKTLRQEDIRLSYAVQNPETIEIIQQNEISYTENISNISLILNRKNPAQEQIIFVLELIRKETAYRTFFFENVKHPVWFNILKSEGEFDYKNRTKLTEGERILMWEPLNFLTIISKSFSKDKTYIKSTLQIIEEVSSNPEDNYITWYRLVNILSNVPNEYIPATILEYIPVWLDSKVNTTLPSSEICGVLLPKFLNESPTVKDIQKAELILKKLFSIEEVETDYNVLYGNNTSQLIYRTGTDMRSLIKTLIRQKLIDRVIEHCSPALLFEIADKLKMLCFHFPKGLVGKITSEDEVFNLEVIVRNQNLHIRLYDEKGIIIGESQLVNFEKYNEKQTREQLTSVMNNFLSTYEENKENQDALNSISHFLCKGLYLFNLDFSVKKLIKRFERNEKLNDAFALLLKEYLSGAVKNKREKILSDLETLIILPKYRLPIFKNIIFYIIQNNWEFTKELFWKMVDVAQPIPLVVDTEYIDDIYRVIDANQSSLTLEELYKLEEIINVGAVRTEIKDSYKNMWKLKWYSALRNTTYFKQRYIELSRQEKVDYKYFEKSRDGSNISWSPTKAPIDSAIIDGMTNSEIVEYIISFKPTGSWGEPTSERLAEEIHKSVLKNPQRFVSQINLYNPVPYIYIYKIFYALNKAWKEEIKFDWEKVLDFCYGYIHKNEFFLDDSSLRTVDSTADAEWVMQETGRLLSTYLRAENKNFDESSLPTIKEIIILLADALEKKEDFKKRNMDYPSYSSNSTGGQVLKAALDYSLCRARYLEKGNYINLWEDEIRDIFNKSFEKEIIDSYILTGWYFRYFLYLDKEWTQGKVESIQTAEEEYRTALIGGYLFERPDGREENYRLFYPYYRMLIEKNIEIKNYPNNSLLKHVVSYYFWGQEDMKEGLVRVMVDSDNLILIQELINFTALQRNYLNNAPEGEDVKFYNRIYQLWEFLLEKFQEAENEEEVKILKSLPRFLELFPDLNEKSTELILKSGMMSDSNFETHYLIERLLEITENEDKEQTALYLTKIVKNLKPHPNRINYLDTGEIIDLVKFIYENGQKRSADEICNLYSKNREFFLQETYNEYN